MTKGNRQHKDRLFNFLFGAEEHREWTLSLYNAVNGSDHKDPEAIEITTIKEVMYLGMHNDVSFLISEDMNLYEQQSTYNPNMPLRLMQYTGNLFGKYVQMHKKNLYGRKLIKLPVPRLVVFYNGLQEQPDEQILKLSDSFPRGVEADIEVQVHMLNINAGRNINLMKACEPLKEYAWMVAEVRKNKERLGTSDVESVVDQAIDAMPEEYIIKPYMEAHRVEVKGMLLTEYNEEEVMKLFREEGREEGLRKGIIDTLTALVRDGLLSIKDAATRAGISEQEFQQIMIKR